ncbi:unnamed protein product [Echinostoma caproni]|uniref:RING/U-box superfamily protein n=1 Tax=Echinostoma caproni TaxID=27848 RepID=A0A183AX03_9TREM|nr:unnamed protein product [Echinostoma caproni]
MTAPDQGDSPVPVRRNAMFRSYRHLPSTGYNSRITLQSNLPRANTSSFRSQYLSSDLPYFWLHRSASARAIPLSHSGSVNNLGENAPLVEDDSFASPRLYDQRQRSIEDFSNINISPNQSPSPSHNVSNPCHMVDDLMNRRSRTNAIRFGSSVPTESNSVGLGSVDAQISLTNRSNRLHNGSGSYSPPDEPLDRSIIFTNPNINGAGPGSIAMRNVSLESVPRVPVPASRLYSRHSSSNPRVVRRRVVLDTTDNPIPPVNNATTNSAGVRRRERSMLSSGMDDRRNSVPMRTGYRSRVNTHHSTDRVRSHAFGTVPPDRPRPTATATTTTTGTAAATITGSSNDREIHVRHVPSIAVVHCLSAANEAPSTTSISGASSIEDVHPSAMMITPDIRRVQNRAKSCESSTREKSSLTKVSDASHALRGNNDWRVSNPRVVLCLLPTCLQR